MKKILSVLLTSVMILSMYTVSFANNGEKNGTKEGEFVVIEGVIEVENFDDIPKFDENAVEGQSYFVADEISPRAYCGNCGGNGYSRGTLKDNTKLATISCPGAGGGWPTGECMLAEYEYYRVGQCRNCGLYEILSYTKTEYEVDCRRSGRVYDVIPGATMANGYDVHECIDPSDYF